MNRNIEHETKEEKKILAHEPVRGYRPALCVCVALGVLYLAVILVKTL